MLSAPPETARITVGKDWMGAKRASTSASPIGGATSSGASNSRGLPQGQPMRWRSDLARILTLSGASGNRVESSE